MSFGVARFKNYSMSNPALKLNFALLGDSIVGDIGLVSGTLTGILYGSFAGTALASNESRCDLEALVGEPLSESRNVTRPASASYRERGLIVGVDYMDLASSASRRMVIIASLALVSSCHFKSLSSTAISLRYRRSTGRLSVGREYEYF